MTSIETLVDLCLTRIPRQLHSSIPSSKLRKRAELVVKLAPLRSICSKLLVEAFNPDPKSYIGVPCPSSLRIEERSKLSPEATKLPPFFPDVFEEIIPQPPYPPNYLIGLRYTVGSIPHAIPPSIKELLRAFGKPHQRSGNKVKLTVGGRALQKHCNRCSEHWWGKANGPVELVNLNATIVILRIISQCVWMNTHMLPHNLAIFEIRVQEGYGARWTLDGREFRGFLEPPSKNGHKTGWHH